MAKLTPRTHPSKGATLRIGRWLFQVLSLDAANRVHYTIADTEARTSLGRMPQAANCSLAYWRDKMQDAEVVG